MNIIKNIDKASSRLTKMILKVNKYTALSIIQLSYDDVYSLVSKKLLNHYDEQIKVSIAQEILNKTCNKLYNKGAKTMLRGLGTDTPTITVDFVSDRHVAIDILCLDLDRRGIRYRREAVLDGEVVYVVNNEYDRICDVTLNKSSQGHECGLLDFWEYRDCSNDDSLYQGKGYLLPDEAADWVEDCYNRHFKK